MIVGKDWNAISSKYNDEYTRLSRLNSDPRDISYPTKEMTALWQLIVKIDYCKNSCEMFDASFVEEATNKYESLREVSTC